MKKKITLFFIIWLLSFIVIVIMDRLSPPISLLIYWIILGLFILTVWFFKLSSKLVFLLSLILFLLAGLMTTLTFTFISERIIRVSFIGWLVGFGCALFEYFSQKRS